jgi:hypothetical protein
MAIRKQDVRDFVEMLSTRSRENLTKQVEAYYKEHFHEELNRIIRGLIGDIPTHGKDIMHKFDSGLTEQLQKLMNSTTNYSGVVQDISDTRKMTAHLFGTVRNALSHRAINTIESGGEYVSYGNEEVGNLIHKLQKDAALQKLLKDKKDVHKLKNELNNVIDTAASGKQALEHLQALGVSTVDFVEKTNANLPAIIHLSADVSLLNGSC